MNSDVIILDPQQYRNHPLSTYPSLSIYLHIPFCTAKCTYCAFNTYIKIEHLIPAFVEAIKNELEIVSRNNPHPEVTTIFFGGGTPTLLTVEQYESILSHIDSHFHITSSAEITTEANPNDLDLHYLQGLKAIGINRLSIGMQSANNNELRFFARRHDHQTVISAVEAARKADFLNINLDLIYGFPYQTIDNWKHTINQALALDVEHFSLYALGLEGGTPLDDWVNQGAVPAPDDDLAADMYDYASEALNQAGYAQYEISNWCRDGLMCHHNLQYWRNVPYIGVGPGAHGFANGIRYAVMRSPQKYIDSLSDVSGKYLFPLTPAVDEASQLSIQDEIGETLIMSLRLIKEGVDRRAFAERFNIDIMALHGEALARFADDGLIDINDARIVLTQKGRLLSNRVFRELV